MFLNKLKLICFHLLYLSNTLQTNTLLLKNRNWCASTQFGCFLLAIKTPIWKPNNLKTCILNFIQLTWSIQLELNEINFFKFYYRIIIYVSLTIVNGRQVGRRSGQQFNRQYSMSRLIYWIFTPLKCNGKTKQ